jgi:predicted nucleic acid-binding protein
MAEKVKVWFDPEGDFLEVRFSVDAAHLAAAEIGGAEIVLTCDDVLIRRAARLGLALRVLNPVAYFNEIKDNG